MTTNELDDFLSDFNLIINSNNDLQELLQLLTVKVNFFDPKEVGDLLRTIKTLDLGRIFFELHSLKESVSKLERNFEVQSLSYLLINIAEFDSSLQNCVKSSTNIDLSNLVFKGIALENTFKSILQTNKLVSKVLIKKGNVQDNEQELSMFFNNTNTYDDVLVKLQNIDELYSEICFLLGISKSEYPLRIVKIETGSLLVNIIGNIAVIGFMIWCLKGAIKFVHRNYTLEGQIEYIPKKIEVAEKALNFSKKLEESGVDVSTIKDDLSKSMLKIISPLNELVSNQAKIKINNEEISVGDEFEQKFLQESEQRLIGDGNQSNKSNNDSSESFEEK